MVSMAVMCTTRTPVDAQCLQLIDGDKVLAILVHRLDDRLVGIGRLLSEAERGCCCMQ